MSYHAALEAAGADITEFAEFGSYQGDWFARIGNTVVCGSYGSCSGCDSFEAEFGWADEQRPDYKARLARFGQNYLDTAIVIGSPEWEQVVTQFRRQAGWDSDAKAVVAWLVRQESI